MPSKVYALSPDEEAIVRRTLELDAGGSLEPLSSDEKNGLRAFLQRAETRLSTYHRIAGVFLNGAGLLVLLPGLARDSVAGVIVFVVSNLSTEARFLVVPLGLSVVIPLYALVLLLRDLVQFYFSPRFLAYDPLRITRFSLAGITLPYDEGIEAKAQVISLKVGDSSYSDFILGGTSPETVERAYRHTGAGNAAFPLRREIMRRLSASDRSIALRNADSIGVALSLAGSLDLSLVGEVARMEASVARHVLLLRKLVLRYTKALILFVWTTLVSIGIAAILTLSTPVTVDLKTALSYFLYATWSGLTIVLIRLPLIWVGRLILQVHPEDEDSDQGDFRDPDLQEFESRITRILGFACFSFLFLAVYVLLY